MAEKYHRLQEEQSQPVVMQPGAAGPPPYPGESYPQQGYPAQGYPLQLQQPSQTHTATNVVVVSQQPTVIVQGKRNWHSGVCGCFDDMHSCCCGLFCHPCMLYRLTEKMGEDCCFCFCYPDATLFGLRVKMRTEQNIQGSLCNDYCLVMWCSHCVLCQMERELKHLGH